MNILLIGDVHDCRMDLEKMVADLAHPGCPHLAQVDLVLCTGDFETLEAVQHLEGQINVPFFFVHGNHDDLDIEFHPSNIHMKEAHINGLTLRGLGGIPPDFFSCSASWESEEDMYDAWPFTGARGGILLTHIPPAGILDQDKDGNHFGSRTVKLIMEEMQPELLVCGHVHENRGEGCLGKTTVINCGSAENGRLILLNVAL